MLRPKFLSADMGISGGNFVMAETGSVVLVTNEGNGGMCTMPRVHVAVTGIEKVLPTLEDLATAMRLLPRSATGQATSNYFSVLTGPRGAGNQDGPEHMYVVLVDGDNEGRSRRQSPSRPEPVTPAHLHRSRDGVTALRCNRQRDRHVPRPAVRAGRTR